MNHIRYWVNSKSTLFCTTTGYFSPFPLPSEKKGEKEKENEVAKPSLNYHFFRIDLKFTCYCSEQVAKKLILFF